MTDKMTDKMTDFQLVDSIPSARRDRVKKYELFSRKVPGLGEKKLLSMRKDV